LTNGKHANKAKGDGAVNTLEAMKNRKSCRAYKAGRIPEEALETILQAGMSAPVASGAYDSLHITVVQNEETLKRIFNATSDLVFRFLKVRKNMDFGAGTLVLVSSRPAMMPGMEYANAAAVVENMVLAATDMGFGNLFWAGAAAAVAQDEELRQSLGIPEGFKPLLCASFGDAANEENAKKHAISVNRE
jgi:nitroreductase